MKTIEEIHRYIQETMAKDRLTHEYRAAGASMEITEKMSARMRELGLSRSEVARKGGVSPAYITKILRGDTNFTVDTLVKIAHALGCELRCHFQPEGAKSQWFDVYTPVESRRFTTRGARADTVITGSFRRLATKHFELADDEENAASA